MAPRIGIINIGHPDYPNEIGQQFAQQAAEKLRSRGVIAIIDDQACTDPIAAARRGQQMLEERLDGVIVWLGTWIEASTAIAAIREFEHLPFAIWGFSMFEQEGRRESTGSFVAASVLKGALERMEYPFKVILGFPEEEEPLCSSVAFAHAAHAYQQLKRTRLGLVGYASMSMYPGTFDHVLMRRVIGPEVVHFDTFSLVQLAEGIGRGELDALAADLGNGAQVEVGPERLAKSARLYGALMKLADRHALNALNVKCQYELSQEYGMTPCVPLSKLADQGIVTACEGDVMLSATMCMLAHLCGETVTYGDILELEGDTMLLSPCGFAPPSLHHEGEPVAIRELGHPGFDGIICSFTLERGPVTFARLVEGRGDYRLVYGTGTGVDTQLRQGRFPALNVRLDGSPERLLETIASQHYALAYGDLSEGIEDLCNILEIEALRV